MEMPVNSELTTGQNVEIPRLVCDRVFLPEGELPNYYNVRQGVLDTLNNAIAQDPTSILDDIAWLEVQLNSGEPIPLRSFIQIKDEQEDDGWAAQRPYIGIIRDTLSITSNGSQFSFGETSQQSEAGWAVVFDKCNEVNREEINNAQAKVYYTHSMVRQARREEAENVGAGTEAKLAYWMQQHTLAKQQRALIRLRSLAVIARGPQLETAETSDVTQEPNTGRKIRDFGTSALKSASFFGMIW